MILLGGCLDILPTLEENSVDACVADGPYGLKFMDKKWDYNVPSIDVWREVLRVLKPGGYLLSFGGTRTYHRMVVNIEDAGFEIRDQIQWLYGSGFPKSHNISKAIDKKAGAEREVLRNNPNARPNSQVDYSLDGKGQNFRINVQPITSPATDAAKQWDGFGTALKPANEPIVLARKPLSEKTVADNVLKWGVGGLNIDGCRVELHGTENLGATQKTTKLSKDKFFDKNTRHFDGQMIYNTQGRFPANILLDESAADMLDEQSGDLGKSQGGNSKNVSNKIYSKYNDDLDSKPCGFGDKGGASRFFYCAKASKSERGTENNHPTVKPIKLMQYLVRLVTPPKGTVLDPFMGSGSTGIACKNEGFEFIGIELDEKYFEIAKGRLK